MFLNSASNCSLLVYRFIYFHQRKKKKKPPDKLKTSLQTISVQMTSYRKLNAISYPKPDSCSLTRHLFVLYSNIVYNGQLTVSQSNSLSFRQLFSQTVFPCGFPDCLQTGFLVDELQLNFKITKAFVIQVNDSAHTLLSPWDKC